MEAPGARAGGGKGAARRNWRALLKGLSWSTACLADLARVEQHPSAFKAYGLLQCLADAYKGKCAALDARCEELQQDRYNLERRCEGVERMAESLREVREECYREMQQLEGANERLQQSNAELRARLAEYEGGRPFRRMGGNNAPYRLPGNGWG
jgi:FtsZ-binding cell division protein ZapB